MKRPPPTTEAASKLSGRDAENVYMTRPNILLSESRGRETANGGWYCTMHTLPQFVHHESLN